MTQSPLLKKLGFSEKDRLVIIHTDDVGMCQATVQAFKDLWEFGTISSGAVMTPCPWFPAVAAMCRQNPLMDMGVHATLNSEWDAYRWAPISTRDPQSGLLDQDGYFHHRQEAVYENATASAVAAELNAQVTRALTAGIDVTHIDTHMGTILHPRFVQSYVHAATSRRIPNMLPRASAQGFDTMGMDDASMAMYAPIFQQLETQGELPMLDGLFSLPLEHDYDHIGLVKKILARIPAGLSHLIIHPSVDTPELRAICPDWKGRVANYQAFMSAALKTFIQDSDIHLIGYRALREAMRTN
jgi:predicted glycoside hydrolase/deacetylase ChbG (UPF0249 family)